MVPAKCLFQIRDEKFLQSDSFQNIIPTTKEKLQDLTKTPDEEMLRLKTFSIQVVHPLKWMCLRSTNTLLNIFGDKQRDINKLLEF